MIGYYDYKRNSFYFLHLRHEKTKKNMIEINQLFSIDKHESKPAPQI